MRQSNDIFGFPQPGTPPFMLPLRCKPFPDESLSSLVMRLAERNGGIRPDDLTRGTLRTFPRLWLAPDEALRFSVFTQLPVEAVFRLCFLAQSPKRRFGPERNVTGYMGQSLSSNDFVLSRRVCVACLREAPYERRIWSIRQVHGCTLHDAPFVDTCPSCRSGLTFDGLLMACRCGQRLDRIAPPEWSQGRRETTAYVVGRLLGSPRPSVPRLDAIRLTDALTLIRWFGMAALSGPSEDLFNRVLSPQMKAFLVPGGLSRTGAYQLQLPGLAAPGHEVLAALVREASGYRLPHGEEPMDTILASEAAQMRADEARAGLEWFGPDGFNFRRKGRVWNVALAGCDCWFARGPAGRVLGPFRHVVSAVAEIELEFIRAERPGEGPIWTPAAENLSSDRGWRAERLDTASADWGSAAHKIVPKEQPPFFVVSGPSGVREGFRTTDLGAAATAAACETADGPAEGMSAAQVLALWEPPECPTGS